MNTTKNIFRGLIALVVLALVIVPVMALPVDVSLGGGVQAGGNTNGDAPKEHYTIPSPFSD